MGMKVEWSLNTWSLQWKLTLVNCGYTTLVLHSRVWQEIHDLCSWDKLFSALSTTSGMWSVIILGLIKMLLKTASFDHLAVYLISEEHHLKQNTPQIKQLSLLDLVPVPGLELTTSRLLPLLGEEPESFPKEPPFSPPAHSWKCCHYLSWRQNTTKLVP